MSNDPVTQFERKFAGMIGADYAIAVNSGTSALHAALEAIDVWGGEVIMPALCPGLVAFPIIHAGGIPIYADVDPATQLITAETIRPLMTKKTRAVIAVALHGLPCDIDAITKLCVPNDIYVIEDCAQALFARYKDLWAGTRGHLGCYSFEKKKHMSTGSEGGMVVTQNAELARRARQFAGLGYQHLTAAGGGTKVPVLEPDYDRFGVVGLNYRLSEIQAEIGLAKLKDVMAAVELRMAIGALWQQVTGPLQPHAYSADNAFYSAAWPYAGDWLKLRDAFIGLGGDGFYAAPRCPFTEPALDDDHGVLLARDCPVAVELQRTLIVLKTHYRPIEAAKRQCQLFAEAVQTVNREFNRAKVG